MCVCGGGCRFLGLISSDADCIGSTNIILISSPYDIDLGIPRATL